MTILVTPTNEKIIENNLLHFSLLHILFANFLYYKNTISLFCVHGIQYYTGKASLIVGT